MTDPTRVARTHLLTVSQPTVEQAICQKIAEYEGPAASLGGALGAMVIGQHFGTRALRMMHSPATIRKYEAILGVRFDEICASEFTPLSQRVVGLRAAQELGGFWDIVMGRKRVANKGWLQEPPRGTQSENAVAPASAQADQAS